MSLIKGFGLSICQPSLRSLSKSHIVPTGLLKRWIVWYLFNSDFFSFNNHNLSFDHFLFTWVNRLHCPLWMLCLPFDWFNCGFLDWRLNIFGRCWISGCNKRMRIRWLWFVQRILCPWPLVFWFQSWCRKSKQIGAWLEVYWDLNWFSTPLLSPNWLITHWQASDWLVKFHLVLSRFTNHWFADRKWSQRVANHTHGVPLRAMFRRWSWEIQLANNGRWRPTRLRLDWQIRLKQTSSRFNIRCQQTRFETWKDAWLEFGYVWLIVQHAKVLRASEVIAHVVRQQASEALRIRISLILLVWHDEGLQQTVRQRVKDELTLCWA